MEIRLDSRALAASGLGGAGEDARAGSGLSSNEACGEGENSEGGGAKHDKDFRVERGDAVVSGLYDVYDDDD